MQELFEINSSKKIYHANDLQIFNEEVKKSYPYVVRMTQNNGIRGYIVEDCEFLNPANTLSFAQDTFSVFYQEKPFYTGNKVKILIPKFQQWNKKIGLSFSVIFQKVLEKFTWGTGSTVETIAKTKISLPVKKDGEIDFAFMYYFISHLEACRLSQLEAYLLVTGLKNYTLTPAEEQALTDFQNGNIEWGEFKVVDLFDVRNTRNILSRDIIENSGDIPYLSASRENNAVSSYISYNKEFLDKGNCIFIGGKTFVVTYQENDFYSNDSHNLSLHLKDGKNITKLNHLFMVSCIYKSLSSKYSWGNSISNKKIQTDFVILPITNNIPDYPMMETLISAVQKLVIKDVVEYADRKIEATKKIINK